MTTYMYLLSMCLFIVDYDDTEAHPSYTGIAGIDNTHAFIYLIMKSQFAITSIKLERVNTNNCTLCTDMRSPYFVFRGLHTKSWKGIPCSHAPYRQ